MASSRHPGAIQDGGCEGEISWSDYFDMDGTDFLPDVRGESSTARLPTLSLPPPPPPQPRPSPLPPRVSTVPGMNLSRAPLADLRVPFANTVQAPALGSLASPSAKRAKVITIRTSHTKSGASGQLDEDGDPPSAGVEAAVQTDCNEELAIARETIRALEERLRVAAEKGDEVAALGSATADDDHVVTISNLRRNKVYPGPVKKPCMVPFYAMPEAWALGILSRAMSWSHQDAGRKATFAEKVFQSNVVFFLALGFVYNIYNMDGGLDPAAVDDDTGITVQNDVEHNVEVLVDAMGRSNIPLGAFDSAEELKKKAKEHLTSKAKIKNLKAAGQNLWTMAPPEDKQHNLHVEQHQIYCEIYVPFHDAQTWKGRAQTMED